MNALVAKANLVDGLKKLKARIARARSDWDDEAFRRFEKEFIEPLEAKVLMATKGLDHVAEITVAARHDCGDEESEWA